MRTFLIVFLMVIGLSACNKEESPKPVETSTTSENVDAVDTPDAVTLSTDVTQVEQ